LEVDPKTGRKNQIRVHLADIGCPVIGDKKYGATHNPQEGWGFTHILSVLFIRQLGKKWI